MHNDESHKIFKDYKNGYDRAMIRNQLIDSDDEIFYRAAADESEGTGHGGAAAECEGTGLGGAAAESEGTGSCELKDEYSQFSDDLY